MIRHPVGVTVSGIILVPQTVIRRLARRYGMKGGEDGLLGLACGVLWLVCSGILQWQKDSWKDTQRNGKHKTSQVIC